MKDGLIIGTSPWATLESISFFNLRLSTYNIEFHISIGGTQPPSIGRTTMLIVPAQHPTNTSSWLSIQPQYLTRTTQDQYHATRHALELKYSTLQEWSDSGKLHLYLAMLSKDGHLPTSPHPVSNCYNDESSYTSNLSTVTRPSSNAT